LAKRFQQAGYAALIYDHRGWGSSEGPANHVDPYQQAEDYHDAVIFGRSLPGIDPDRICIWGIGHSGGAAIMSAGDDPHIRAVIAVMPWLSGKADAASFPEGLLNEAWKEHEAITRGAANGQKYVKVWDDSEEEAAGEDLGETLIHGGQAFDFLQGAKKLSDAAGTPWQNRLTLHSLYAISRAEPQDHVHKISPKPFLHLAAPVDPLSGPIERQWAAFAKAGQPKEFVELPDHHIANYFGENFEVNVHVQIDFLRKYV
jgi:uncharacterized protein